MIDVSSQNSTLYVADVRKAFGRRQVLDRVDFTLERGELAGIVGENGAGKTTLLRILAGELKPDHGWVIPRGRLGYCPQRTVLNDSLTVAQHLRYFQRAYQLEDLHRAHELVERLNFTQYRASRVRSLSGGTRQKLNLVIALMHDPVGGAAGRAVPGLRLGDLPALLGTGRRAAGHRALAAGDLPPQPRHRPPGHRLPVGQRGRHAHASGGARG